MKKNFEILMAFFKPFRNKDIDFSWEFATYDEPDWISYVDASIKGVPENIMDYIISFIQFYYEKIVDDLWSETEWVAVGVRIYPEDKKLSFYSRTENYSQEDDYYTSQINSPELEEYFKRTGVEIIEATYSGSGDSGDIDSVTIDGKSTNIQYGSQDDDEKLIWNTLYGQLENAYGGWEINEGSSGSINYNFQEQKVMMTHYQNVESTELEHYMTLKF